MSERLTAARPKWWPAWTDYPHGGFSEKQARELSRYAVELEAVNAALRDDLRHMAYCDHKPMLRLNTMPPQDAPCPKCAAIRKRLEGR